MIFTRTNFVAVHSVFRETDNFRFQFLLGFAPGHEFLHCGGHYLFDRPSILIRDLSQQSHRPLRQGIDWPAADCEGCDVLRRFRDRFHAVRFALLSARAQETSAKQLCDYDVTEICSEKLRLIGPDFIAAHLFDLALGRLRASGLGNLMIFVSSSLLALRLARNCSIAS